MQSDHGSTESVSVAWLILCDVLFVPLVPRATGQQNESQHEWSWHTRLIPVCATPKSNQKAPDPLAEEFGSVEAFGGKGSLYKKSSTYPKKAVQGAVR